MYPLCPSESSSQREINIDTEIGLGLLCRYRYTQMESAKEDQPMKKTKTYMLFIILHRLRLGTRIAIWLTLLLLGTTAAKAQTETVKLKNGKTYEVRTKHGLPLNFESNQIKVTNVGLTGSTKKSDKMQFLWFLSAELREKGKFVVTVTTPLDETISTTFECNGRGKIFQTFLGSAEYPALWALLEEPGTSWIPFVFSFEDKGSGKKFEVTQWSKFDSAEMKELRELIKRAEESTRSAEIGRAHV